MAPGTPPALAPRINTRSTTTPTIQVLKVGLNHPSLPVRPFPELGVGTRRFVDAGIGSFRGSRYGRGEKGQLSRQRALEDQGRGGGLDRHTVRPLLDRPPFGWPLSTLSAPGQRDCALGRPFGPQFRGFATSPLIATNFVPGTLSLPSGEELTP